ncbi:acyl carrier protein [Flagellimonas meridianipacifica]|uniref:Acyl carrier protein n=1 Tax=Flagellimonas meridianipacifica TaxID=1080225 RepID=A0A2T0MCU4_9FLAO|nr:acyl carrier protein [Allomuricauda pacifica]PRX55306.1 acyl carrier protein [Allomuricauda pacifica]
MSRNEVLKEINEIFIDTLDNQEIVLDESTQAADIDQWDSLMHVLLVDAMEKHFDIRFKSGEIQNWKNVGEIIDSIDQKSNN